MTNLSTTLNVGHLLLESHANGPGKRTVVWVQGCLLLCNGCINKDLIPKKPKRIVLPSDLIKSIIAKTSGIEGLTLSGGEPFDQPEACLSLLSLAKSNGLSTMVYTGYIHEHLVNRRNQLITAMLKTIDILIDGPYKQDLSANLLWRGSKNQRILFLTDRYSEKILENSFPHEEIVFEQQGKKVTRSGIIRSSAQV